MVNLIVLSARFVSQPFQLLFAILFIRLQVIFILGNMDALHAQILDALSAMIRDRFIKGITALHAQCIILLMATVPDAILVFHIILKLAV